MLREIAAYPFLQNAALGAVLAGIACGVIGAVVVEKKLLLMSGGIAHTAFGGIGLAYLLGFPPLGGALLFAVGAAAGISAIRRQSQSHTDVAISLFWAVGMAAGVLCIKFAPGYPPDLSAYLFGDILTVTRSDLGLMLLLDIAAVGTVAWFFDVYQAYLFDAEFARVCGINTGFLDRVLFVLIALTVVVLLRLVGIVLTIAMLTAPAAIARLYAGSLRRIMILAVGVSLGLSLGGLWLSYVLDIPSGAAIVLLTGAAYGLALLARPKLTRMSRQRWLKQNNLCLQAGITAGKRK